MKYTWANMHGMARWTTIFRIPKRRLEAIAIRLEAIASRLEAIASRLEAIACRVEAIDTSKSGTALRSVP